MGFTVAWVSSIVEVFTLDVVMSARVEASTCEVSGDVLGLSAGGAKSGTDDIELRGAAFLRFFGEAFVGDSGSGLIIESVSSSLGSADGVGRGVFFGRPRPFGAAAAGAEAEVLRPLRVFR